MLFAVRFTPIRGFYASNSCRVIGLALSSLLWLYSESYRGISCRACGFYPNFTRMILEFHLLSVSQASDALNFTAVNAMYGKWFAVPSQDEGIDDTILAGEPDIILYSCLVGACGINAFTIGVKPLAYFQQYLLLVFGNCAVALGRNIQAKVSTTSYVVHKVADNAVGILQFKSLYVSELIANGVVHLPVARSQ